MANIFEVNRPNNKITLGTTGTTINVASHTASKTLALDASKNLESIQDLRTSASPEFAGVTVVNAITEFSTDGTMGGDSDSAVPTEKATKLYTDTLRSDLASTANAKGASLVGVEDSASLFTATNVETALAEVMDKVTPVTTTGNSITTPTGTVDAGDINSTTTIDDNDSYDVSEVTGSPGFDIQITFTGIASGKEPNKVQLHISYDGSAGHNVDLEMWNYTGSPQWDVISADFLPDTGGVFAFYEIDIPGTVTDYVSGGEAKLRFNHSSAGNANHDVSIDFAALKHDLGSGAGVTEHGALSGLGDDDHTQYLLADGTRALTGNLIVPDGGTIGQAAGPLLTFDDTNNYLEITGCKVGFGIVTPGTWVDIAAANKQLRLTDTDDSKFWQFSASATKLAIRYQEDEGDEALALLCDSSGNVGVGATPVTRFTVEGTLTLKEQAAADGDTAAYGQIWVKSDAPNTLWFTDDGGADIQLGTGGTYVDRGDPAAWDWIDANLTTDGNWNDLDLSSIVPVGAKTVLLRVRIIDDATDKAIQMRENGNSNGYNVAALVTLVANLSIEGNFIVGCDADRVIEYNASNTSWTNIDICVRGWWT